MMRDWLKLDRSERNRECLESNGVMKGEKEVIDLNVCLCGGLSLFVPVCLYVCLSDYPSAYLCMLCLSVSLAVRVSVQLSVCRMTKMTLDGETRS